MGDIKHRGGGNKFHIIGPYRCYALKKGDNGERELRCKFLYKSINLHMPRVFVWHAYEDRDTLEEYIKALAWNDKKITKEYEDKELAYGHEYIDASEKPQEQMISADMLISVLLGEYPLNMPVNSYLRIQNSANGNKFLAGKFMASLADAGLLEAWDLMLEERIRTGKRLRLREALQMLEGRREKFNSNSAEPLDFNVHYAVDSGQLPDHENYAQQRNEAIMQEVVSRPLKTIQHNGYHEVVVACVAGERRYFARQFYLPSGKLILAMSAWSLEGPWTTSYRDNTEINLLGLEVAA